MYFHSPAVPLQLLFIVDGRRSFVVGGVVRPAPVYLYVVEVGDRVLVVVVVAASGRTTRHVVVGVVLFSHHAASTACKFTLHWLAVSI